MAIFVLFVILYVINSNIQGRELSNTEVNSIMTVGIVSPLISSIVCIFVQPQSKERSFIVGVMAFIITFVYLSAMLLLYIFVFKGVSYITGL